MAARTIQTNIKRNTKDFAEYSLFLGGLDVSAKNIGTASSIIDLEMPKL